MHRASFILAVAAAAALILSAPFVSQVRHFLRDRFPGNYVLILGVIVGGSVAVAIAAALLRIRDRRALRYGAICAAIAIGASYSVLTASPDPQVAAVERFHFVQYGLITLLFYRTWRPLGDAGVLIVPAIAAMLTATVEEWFQWFIPGRVGVVQDVFLNWVAIVCGLLFSVGLDAPARLARVLSGRSLRHIGGAAAIFTVVFGMFFDAVHVGHVIRDERIGSFVSLYTVDELRAHGRDRARRWEVEPPIDRTRLAREDQYRTEGIQHVQARNRAWERGDIDGAWRENLILETYYEPVLRRGHQWPDEQHADAVRRAAAGTTGGGREYASPAYPYAVHDWPPAAFWAVVISIAAGVLWLTRRLARSRPAGRNAADAAV